MLILWAMLMKSVYKDVPLKSKEIPLHGRATAVHPDRDHHRLDRDRLHYPPFDNEDQNSQDLGNEEGKKTKATDGPPRVRAAIPVAADVRGRLARRRHRRRDGLMSVRRQRELLAATPIRETLEEVLTETLDDLRREPDPRKAVIGAYSNMERTLAARGVPRHESEAPDEYLARILEVVGASGHSVRRLTRLFARARYSPHEIDLQMKEDAIDALTGLRAELAAR